MKRLKKINDTMKTRDFVIPLTPDYDCFDYFKARDPKRLKKLKELHDNQEYLTFDELVRPKYDKEIKKNYISRLRKIAVVKSLRDFYPNSYEYEYVETGIQEVEVDKIVGITSGRVNEYNDDWTPKNPDDERWQYQINLIKSGQQMEPIPLIKMPDGNYVGNGDGSHRIAAAHVMRLKTVQAYVTVMVDSELNINEKWEEHSKEKRNKLKELSDKYKKMNREIADLYFEDPKSYEEKSEELYDLGDEISELDNQLIEEEKEFKTNFLNSL